MTSMPSSPPAAARRAIRWRGLRLELLAAPAIHLRRSRTLIVADLHLGKAASFRSAGVPVPAGGTQRDLERLSRALAMNPGNLPAEGLKPVCPPSPLPRRLIILGDLFHARAGCDDRLFDALRAWRGTHPQLKEIILVRGNHDHHAGDPPADLGFTCVDEPFIADGLALRHRPPETESVKRCGTRFPRCLAGHVHPCAVLHDVSGSSLRVPCFLFGRETALLPAFGGFTGMHPVRPRRGERVFALGENEIVEVKSE